MRKIAVIVGNGTLPKIFLKEGMRAGFDLYPIGLFDTIDEEIKLMPRFRMYNIGQFSEITKYLIHNDVHEMILLGKVEKELVFKDIKLDDIGEQLLAKMPDRKDETLLFGIISFFRLMKIRILPQNTLISKLAVEKKCYTTRQPDENDMKTIKIGIEAAKALSRVDAGQTVVCKDMSVIALEGIEGTDKCIARGGMLGGHDTIIVKMSRPQQDMRVDVPTAGLQTIQSAIDIGAKGIVIESRKMLFVEQEKCIELANNHNMFVLGI